MRRYERTGGDLHAVRRPSPLRGGAGPAAAEGADWDVEVRRGPEVHDTSSAPPGDVIAVYETGGGEDWCTATRTDSGYRMRP